MPFRDPEKRRAYEKQRAASDERKAYQREIEARRPKRSDRWAKTSPEVRARKLAGIKQWRDANPERVRSHNTKSNEKRRINGKQRAAHLKARYNMTVEQWDALFEAQDRCCAICKAESSGFKYGWHTDHCHKTRRVRGILCHVCNRLLGYVKDDPARLRAFIDYLGGGKPNPPG